jgi:hypothetical protein
MNLNELTNRAMPRYSFDQILQADIPPNIPTYFRNQNSLSSGEWYGLYAGTTRNGAIILNHPARGEDTVSFIFVKPAPTENAQVTISVGDSAEIAMPLDYYLRNIHPKLPRRFSMEVIIAALQNRPG